MSRELHRTVEEAKETVSAEEFAGWMEFWQANPEHHERMDFRFGMLSSLLCTLHNGKMPASHEPLDFMPYSRPRQLSDEEQAAAYERRVQRAINCFATYSNQHNAMLQSRGLN